MAETGDSGSCNWLLVRDVIVDLPLPKNYTHIVNNSSMSAVESSTLCRILTPGTTIASLVSGCGGSTTGFVVKPGAQRLPAELDKSPNPPVVDPAGDAQFTSVAPGLWWSSSLTTL